MINYYEVLNCCVDSTLEEIRKNYKKLALKFHPDKKNADTESFLRIQEAWNVLSDEKKRQQFDLEIELRSSHQLLYGSFKIAELARDSLGNYHCSCRCGGMYVLDEEDLKLVCRFQMLHVPCENCSLTMENCGCKEKCFLRVTEVVRKRTYEKYQDLITNNEKYLYLTGLIYKENGNEFGKLPRKAEFLFHVRVNGYHVRICSKAFEIIHGITSNDVCKLLKRLKSDDVIYPITENEFVERVKLKPKAKSANAEDQVKRQVESIKLKPNAKSTNAKDQVKKHVESVLMKPEVKEQLLKGNLPNFVMLYEDYKIILEMKGRTAALKFNEQSENEEDEDMFEDYNPVSLNTYISLFREVYPTILEKLRKEGGIAQFSSLLMSSKTQKVEKKSNAGKVRKRKNSPDRSIQSSSTSTVNDSILTQKENQERCERRSYNVCSNTCDTDESAVYVLPPSTKILTKANLTNTIVEMVYYI